MVPDTIFYRYRCSRLSYLVQAGFPRYLFAVPVIFMLALAFWAQDGYAGSLSAVSPMGASSAVTIHITGTGFSTTASRNEVTFVPSSGVSATATATAVTTLDSATGLRRLAVKIPTGLSVGPTPLRVLNTATGEVSDGKSIEVIEITLPEVTSAPLGATNLNVRINGSSNTKFLAGSTRAAFGTGVTVNATTVESPTSLVADITVSSTAATGTRAIGVTTSTQTAVLLDVFSLIDASVDPPPLADAGPDQNAAVGALVTLDGSASTDLDGGPSPLTYGWTFTVVPPASALTNASIANATSAAPSFTPDVAGTYLVTLQVSDGALADDDQVQIVAFVPNVAPNADAGPDQNVLTGTLVTLDGSGSHDPDNAPSPLTFRWTFTSVPPSSALTNGQISNSTTPAPSFTPDAVGTYVLTLEVSDGDQADNDQVSIIAAASNVTPNAVAGPDQTVRTGRVATLDGSGSNDPDNGPSPLSFSWTFVSVPPGSALANGSITAADTNAAIFTPDVDGTFVVNLQVTDGDRADNDQVMLIAANTAPLTVDDAYTVDEDTPLTVGAPTGVLGNDSDADGDRLSAVLVSPTTRGAVTLTSDGAFSYAPDPNVSGVDRFTYGANDGDLDSNVATVTITVNPLNDPPVAHAGPDDVVTVGDTVQLAGIASSDPDGDALSYQWTLLSVPTGSAAVLSNPAGVNPTMTPDLVGTYLVALIVSDGTVNSTPDTMTIAANAPPNRAPLAADDAYGMQQGGVLAVSAADGVLANDSDLDGDVLSAVVVTGTSNGVLTFNPNGAFGYTPDLAFAGTDSFTYRASDGSVDSIWVTVFIRVNPSDTSVLNLAITSPVDGAVVSTATIDVEGTVSNPLAYVDVNGVEAQVFPDGRFVAPRVRLNHGFNEITAQATGPTGESDIGTIWVSYEIPAGPLGVSLLTPEDGALIESPYFRVMGTVSDPTATVLVNDSIAQVDEHLFTANIYACQDQGPVPTAYVLMAQAAEGGGCTITVSAYTNGGQSAISTTTYTYVPSETPLAVTITAPAQESVITASSVEIRGLITDVLSGMSPTEVTVNGLAATVSAETFSAMIPLTDGINYVTVHASNFVGSDAYDAMRVVYEAPSRPLTVTISSPIDGAVVNRPQIPILGVMSDSSARVDVNGIGASQDFRSFRLDALSLSVGENVITATAVRPNGEVVDATVRISYDPAYPSPPEPILGELPPYATTTFLNVSGLTLPSYTARIFVNGDGPTAVTADATGLFQAAVRLNTEGPNQIAAQVIDPSGNVSPLSREAVVIRDAIKPRTSLRVRTNDFDQFGLAVSRIPIHGVTEPAAQVEIVIDNDQTYHYSATADANGWFEIASHLSAGLHDVRISTTDQAGNTAANQTQLFVQPLNWASILMAYSAIARAPVIDPIPNPITESSLNVEGRAYAGFAVEVYRNGELMGTAPVNSRGRFRLGGIGLVPGRNVLRVRQVEQSVVTPWSDHVVMQGADSREVIVDVVSAPPGRPAVTIDFPADGASTDAELLPVRGMIDISSATVATEPSLYYLCCGVRYPGVGFVSNHLIPLIPGENVLSVEAVAADGSRDVRMVRVFSRMGASVPTVTITSPTNGEEVFDQFISVVGSVGDGVGTVIADKDEAALSGNNFFSGFMELIDLYPHPSGLPTVMVWATDGIGRIGYTTASDLRYRYLPSPSVFIIGPSEGEVVGSSPVTVTGVAFDASDVTVNGTLARLDGTTFTAQVDLQAGANIITVVATNAGKGAVTRTEVSHAPGISLQALRLEPAQGALPLGGTLALAAIGEYSNGVDVDMTRQAVWTSSDPAVATISSNGVVTGHTRGSTTLTATYAGFTASRVVGVGDPALQTIVVAYAWGTDFLTTGSPDLTVGETLGFKAFGVMSDETLLDITARVTWTSSAPTVAAVDGVGVATAIGSGGTQITASYQGQSGSRAVTVHPPPMYLFITSPTDGSSLNRSETTVSGTVISSAAEVGIVVNGVVANVIGNQFAANGVELLDGGNVIIARAVDSNGAVAEDRVVLQAVTTAPQITLRTEITAGLVPLDMILRIDSTFGSFPTSTLSYSGPGTAEITTISPKEYQVRLSTEGLYTFTASVTSSQGQVYTDALTITVANQAQLDALLQSKWAGMKAALSNNDVTTALKEIAFTEQDGYREILSGLGPILGQIDLILRDISLVSMAGHRAEYQMIRVDNGVPLSYFVLFVKDRDGIWRLKFF